jgi:hypothetical protein
MPLVGSWRIKVDGSFVSNVEDYSKKPSQKLNVLLGFFVWKNTKCSDIIGLFMIGIYCVLFLF